MNTTPTTSGANMQRIQKGIRITGPVREELTEQLVTAYHGGRSVRRIAADLGRSYGFVHRLLVEAGVELRSRGGAGRR